MNQKLDSNAAKNNMKTNNKFSYLENIELFDRNLTNTNQSDSDEAWK